MEEFWNKRYAAQEYAYGINPNKYFKQEIDKLAVGKLLLPGEGEGRNAVYAAKLGWSVKALDMSGKGREKALKLATENKVQIDYDICDLIEYQYPDNEYDAIVLVFVHFPAQIRKIIHGKLAKSLKPGGILLMHAFSKKQIEHQSGGPRAVEMLYTLDDLFKDFEGFEILEALEIKTELDEGEFHRGVAEVLQFKVQKT